MVDETNTEVENTEVEETKEVENPLAEFLEDPDEEAAKEREEKSEETTTETTETKEDGSEETAEDVLKSIKDPTADFDFGDEEKEEAKEEENNVVERLLKEIQSLKEPVKEEPKKEVEEKKEEKALTAKDLQKLLDERDAASKKQLEQYQVREQARTAAQSMITNYADKLFDNLAEAGMEVAEDSVEEKYILDELQTQIALKNAELGNRTVNKKDVKDIMTKHFDRVQTVLGITMKGKGGVKNVSTAGTGGGTEAVKAKSGDTSVLKKQIAAIEERLSNNTASQHDAVQYEKLLDQLN